MTSIVLELQRDALDRAVSITDLLRKALVVARKLKQDSLLSWINSELDGYSGDEDIPEYREMAGQVRGWNPVHGWVPVIIDEPGIMETISKKRSGQSISEIQNLLDRQDSRSTLHMPFSPGQQQVLRKAVNFNTEFSLFISQSGLSRIVDSVRNTVLSWALQLEDDGILGEGLSFSASEKETAAHQNYNINNFFGDVTSSQLQQASGHGSRQHIEAGLNLKRVEALATQLRIVLDKLELEQGRKAEVESDLVTIDSQLRSPNPKQSIIKESLRSIRSILEGAGGGVAAQVLIEIGKVLI